MDKQTTPPQKKNKAKETKNKKQSKDLYYVFVLCIWRHQETLPGEGVINRVLVCALRWLLAFRHCAGLSPGRMRLPVLTPYSDLLQGPDSIIGYVASPHKRQLCPPPLSNSLSSLPPRLSPEASLSRRLPASSFLPHKPP